MRENETLRTRAQARLPVPRPDEQERRDAERVRAGADGRAQPVDDPRSSARAAPARSCSPAPSTRRARAHGGPFVAVSCAALTETLLESELFGHEKGAFTGAAARRRGTFETAHGGTLFLDEIGDISPKLQVELLRVLEDAEVLPRRRQRADRGRRARHRRDQPRPGEGGRATATFRDDLFYRLNVIPITLPPLRDRREDIPLLVEHFLERMSAELGRKVDGVSRDAMAMLMDVPLARQRPRAAQHRRARDGVRVGRRCCRSPTSACRTPSAPATAPRVARGSRAAAHRGDPGAGGGNVSQAARMLDIDRVTLYNKIRKYGLREPD